MSTRDWISGNFRNDRNTHTRDTHQVNGNVKRKIEINFIAGVSISHLYKWNECVETFLLRELTTTMEKERREKERVRDAQCFVVELDVVTAVESKAKYI